MRGRFQALLDQFAIVRIELDEDAVTIESLRDKTSRTSAAEDVHANRGLHRIGCRDFDKPLALDANAVTLALPKNNLVIVPVIRFIGILG